MRNWTEEIEQRAAWLRQCVQGAGCTGITLGLSGGKDSAVVVALAARAVGAGNVLGVSLP